MSENERRLRREEKTRRRKSKAEIHPRRLMGEDATCAYLGGISRWKYWDLIKKGELDAIDVDGLTKVTIESADALIERGRVKRAERLAASATITDATGSFSEEGESNAAPKNCPG